MADMTKGKHANIELITGDPKKAINKLAWPMMLSMLLIMLYNLADSVWVSGLGADALAALGFITPLFMIIVGLGNGIGAGANSLIARAFGAKKDELANNAIKQITIKEKIFKDKIILAYKDNKKIKIINEFIKILKKQYSKEN